MQNRILDGNNSYSGTSAGHGENNDNNDDEIQSDGTNFSELSLCCQMQVTAYLQSLACGCADV